jgi:hypothetical protein
MSRLEKIDKVMKSESCVKTLLDVIINDYGVRDVVDCLFYNLNTEDQNRFLDDTLSKAGGME